MFDFADVEKTKHYQEYRPIIKSTFDRKSHVMEITGKIIKMLPLASGEGRNGTWKKQEFILETEGQYPKQICMHLWGDKIDEFSISEGEQVKAMFDISSREYNNRWYTDVRVWRIEKGGAEQVDQSPPESQFIDVDPQQEDDLPF